MINIAPTNKNVNPVEEETHISTWPSTFAMHEITAVDKVQTTNSAKELTKRIIENHWSPIIFKMGYRLSKNFEASQLCVLDVDDTLSLLEAVEKFKDYKHIIATTENHQKVKGDMPKCDKYRVVLWFDKKLTSQNKYVKVMKHYLTGPWKFSDPQCKDAARFYKRCYNEVSVNETGKLVPTDLDFDALAPKAVSRRYSEPSQNFDINALVGEKGGRNNALTSYAGRIWGGQIDTREKLFDALLLANLQIAPPSGPLPEQEVRTIANSISSRAFNWSAGLKKTEKGKIKAIPENLEKILTRHPDWVDVIRFDEWNNQITLQNPPYKRPYNTSHLLDEDTTWIRIWLSAQLDLLVSPKEIDAQIRSISKNNPCDPFKEHLDTKVWDGVDRLKDVATMFGAELTAYHTMIICKWMLGAVTRAFQPGYKFDNVLLLAGKQGIGKSSLLQNLVFDPNQYMELVSNINNKDTLIGMQGKWIVDFSELDCLNKKENTAIKVFITSLIDEFRPVYGKINIKRPRRCVFAGTTNDQEILRDPSGARRFWVLPIKRKIDVELIKKNRDQLWAQVLHIYKSKTEPTWLNSEEEILQQEANEEYQEVDVWESMIHEYMHRKKSSSTRELLERVIGKEIKEVSKADKNRVSSILRRLGCDRKQIRSHGVREYIWSLE